MSVTVMNATKKIHGSKPIDLLKKGKVGFLEEATWAQL